MGEFYVSTKKIKKGLKSGRWLLILIGIFLFTAAKSNAQTTSWKGTQSTGWSTSANWTNGVPSAATDVIIGDVNFTGAHSPVLNNSTTIKSLVIGGQKTVTFSVSHFKTNLKVTNDITIEETGTLAHAAATLHLGGDWINKGTYRPTLARQGNKTYNARILLNGTAQTISGATSFMDLTVNQSSTAILGNPITVTHNFIVAGTFDPAANLVTLINAKFVLDQSGTIRIKASAYSGNYSIAPTTINTNSTIEYAADDRNQTINAIGGLAFPTLVISGGTTKTLSGNISFTSASSSVGKLLVNNGILDLGGYTANRGIANAGGFISIANGAALKIGGTNTFPANFSTRTFEATSTVEYSGGNQTVSNEAYGHLVLSANSGSLAVKTMPTVALVTAGDLIATATGTGTAVSFTARQNITVNGNLSLGANTTFNGASFTHTLDGDWINQEGVFNAGTSAVFLRGISKKIRGNSHTTFHNLTITGDIQGQASAITVAGNFATSGAGAFLHAAEVNGSAAAGTFTMSGTARNIMGADIYFDNLVVSGSVTSASDLVIAGNLNVSSTTANAFNLTAGTVMFSGTGKTITAGSAGSIAFNALQIAGTVSTGASFGIASDLSGLGTLTATAGTITFRGTSTYAGVHKLFNVALNGTMLQLAANATLGVVGNFTLTAGVFDVTTSAPNTVEYAGGNQTVTGTTYHTLLLSGTGSKIAGGAFTANGNLEIKAGATLSAGTFTHIVKGNWLNNGTFTANTSTIQFEGSEDDLITGSNVFNNLVINKSTAVSFVTLGNNISVANVAMTMGEIRTGSSVLTITNGRTGNGAILGTITRTHTFAANTAYAFGNPFNTISFGAVSGVTSVTVKIASGTVNGFPFGGSINRLYTISIPAGTYSDATLRLHYNDRELNGNTEDAMLLWNKETSWISAGKSANNATDNWVERSSLGSVTGEWTISNHNNVLQWVGITSNDWHTASNWSPIEGATAVRVPTATDIVEIGTYNFDYHPIITGAASVKSLHFGSFKPATLTLAEGELEVAGNLNGTWSANATHTLAVGSQNLTILGNLELSNGTAGQAINLAIGTGRVYVGETLVQAGGAAISFSGSGSLVIDDNFLYTNGTFTAGTGTVTYIGNSNQVVAGNISYNNLIIDKSIGTATLVAPATVLGSLALATGGSFVANNNLIVSGDVAIGTGTTFNGAAGLHSIGGNWTNHGTFQPSTSTIRFNGNGAQSLSSSTFNNLVIAKATGKVTLTGNVVVNANMAVEAGEFELGAFTLRRSAVGGTFTLGANAALYVSGANNFPGNFNTNTLATTSTVFYNCPAAQSVARVSYGNLQLQNGNTNAKTLAGATTVKGNLVINNGATLGAGSFTLTAQGNITNLGTFQAGTGTVILAGISKDIEGPMAFHDLTITGNYNFKPNSPVTIANSYYNSGTVVVNANTTVFSGDFTNEGTILTDGITIFSGTRQQTLQLRGISHSPAFTSQMFFNGTVTPIMNSTSAPNFISVVLNNSAGVAPSIGWTVHGLFQVNNGSAFHGGSSSHNFHGAFVNEGTVTSDGLMNFSPSADQTIGLGTAFTNSATVRFGGSGKIVLSSSPSDFANIEIANTNVAGLTFPKSLTLTGGLTIKAGSVLYAGDTLRHTIKKLLNNEGVLNGNTSTFTFNGPEAIMEGTGTTNFHHLILSDTTTIASNINIKGDLTNNGELSIEQNIIHFNGTTAQAILGTREVPFSDLTVSNPAGFTLNRATTVAGTLHLQNGNVTTNGHILTVGSSATDPGDVEVEGTGMVDGKLKRWLPASSSLQNLFPVGSGNTRRLATIDYTTSPSGGTLMAEFIPANPGTAGLPLTETIDEKSVSINKAATTGFWSFTAGTTAEEALTGGQYDATFEAINFEGVAIMDNLVVVKRPNNTQPWSLQGDYTPAKGTLGSPIISRTGLTGFSDFAVAGTEVIPLPVTLTAFKVMALGIDALVTWTTASEINSHGFFIEVSVDARQYHTLGFIQSKEPNSGRQQNYKFVDTENGKAGARYYRIMQVDLDGKATYYGPQVVTFKKEAGRFAAHPNPFTEALELLVEANADETAIITLQDINGRTVLSTKLPLVKGQNRVPIKTPENLAKGVYLLKAKIGQTTKVTRLLKE